MTKSGWFWDWAAKRYDRQARKDDDLTRDVERIRKYLEADATVLDYACGTGVVTYLIAGDVKAVHAIDASAKMIEIAQQRAREREVANVRFEQKTIFDEGLESDSYDVILAFNILHLLQDPPRAVQRAGELLKPGGVLVSVTPCLGESGVVLRTVLRLVSKAILPHLSALRVSDVRELMSGGGLEILESEAPDDVSIRSYLSVARKG